MATYGDLKVSTINGGMLSGFRNAIINGNFGINQRVVSGTVSLAAGAYGHDRWKAGASGCTYTFATVENVTTITISAGSLIQVVEGLNLMTGTYSLSWQGTAQGKIGAGSYGNSGIAGSVTGGTNLNIEFGTGTLSLVQLEKGTVATPFEFRSIGQELALCQRYLPKWEAVGANKTVGVGLSYAATQAVIYLSSPVTLRTPPTGMVGSGVFQVLNAGAGGIPADGGVVFNNGSVNGMAVVATVASGLSAGNATNLIGTDSYIYGTGCEL